MADASIFYSVTRITIDPITWTPLAPIINCCELKVANYLGTVDIKIRSDSGRASSELTIGPGFEENVDPRLVANRPEFTLIVFPAGVTVVFAQTTSGTFDVVLVMKGVP
jgi:hypothetical protein